MKSQATTVEQYLAELPPDRRETLQTVRSVILENLPEGYEEGIQYGMIGYFVPHSVYPNGYHCDPKQPLPFMALASQKNHMAVYLMCIYSDPKQEKRFRTAWTKTGKKLDMGKSCVRFKKIEDVPLEVIGRTVKGISVSQYIKQYETVLDSSSRKPASTTTRKKVTRSKKATPKKTPAKKKSVTKRVTKKKITRQKATKSKTTAPKKTTRKKPQR